MDKLEEMEQYAKLHNIPIMEKEGIAFLCGWIEENNVLDILEIGSAIGYSAIRMALVNKDIHIDTIERDDDRYQEAKKNVDAMRLHEQINLFHEDALTFSTNKKYDLIFIDAAKAQYIKFFEKYEHNLKQNGYIISDNLKFHGFVEHPEQIQSRNLKQMVRKIQKYIDYLKDRKDYQTKFYEIGDGIAITTKIDAI